MTGKCKLAVHVIAVLLLSIPAYGEEQDYSEEAGKKFLEKLNDEMSKLNTESTQASWDYESNITDHNLKHQLEVSKKVAKFTKESWKEVIKYPWRTFKDPDTKRQFMKYSFLGSAALSPEKYERLEKVVKDMQGVYGKAKICDFRNTSRCDLHLEPEITELFAKSRDPNELQHLWTEWRKASGKPVRTMFTEYVALSNEAAKLNNFTDASQSWLKDYESDDFTEQVEGLWQQVRPLYVQLHAYVRRRLRELYGEDVVSKTGPIPAHLLGNVWAQTWSNVLNDTVPYPDKPNTDVTSEMVEQKYTPLKMFKVAEEFFTSLGLSPMPETFWKNSIIEKPADGRDLICHASAWDFYDGKDFRIKQCTRINKEDLETVHHEMGHVQYYLQYKNLPFIYKEGANPGFHEAVGDVMALSVSTPKHLHKIGLLKNVVDDEEAEINQLFGMALDKVAFLPFAYLMDQWRWGVFQGKITESDYNSKWWEFREQYQGMQPPTQRTEEDFDPGAKYHIVASVPYIRYFVSFIIQFQFHRSLCIAAGEFDPENPNLKPLHKCDIYQNKKAGELLGNMLKMGSSKPWPDAMEVITGQRKMDAGALLQYFSTLQTWLERENARTGEYIGWEPSSNPCEEDRVHYYELEQPDDTFEDDNIGYSYAELVPPNDNSFDTPDYHEKLEPWLHLLPHRLTENENEFEVNKNIDGRYTKKDPPSSLEKLFQISEEQGERVVSNVKKGFGQQMGLEDADEIDMGTAKRTFRKFAEYGGEIYHPGLMHPDFNFNFQMDGRSEKEHSDMKQPSTFTRLLSSIGSSMPRPKVMAVNQKNNFRSAQSGKNPYKSDLMWDAEMMKYKAEKMLKSFDAPDKQLGMANPGNSMTYRYDRPPMSLNPVHQPFHKNLLQWLQYPVKNRRETPKNRKLAKKSYIHYHYNIRTPVYYNTIIMKAPTANTWVDEDTVKTRMSHQSDQDMQDNLLQNYKYNDKWKSIKLVPVDRNRDPDPVDGSRSIRRRRFLGAPSKFDSGWEKKLGKDYVRRKSDNIDYIFQLYFGVAWSVNSSICIVSLYGSVHTYTLIRALRKSETQICES